MKKEGATKSFSDKLLDSVAEALFGESLTMRHTENDKGHSEAVA